MTDLVSKALPLAATAAGYYFGGPTGALIASGVSQGVSAVIQSRQQAKIASQAQQQQAAAQATQTAVQNRQQNASANAAATTDLQTADMTRAIAAGRRNRGGLAFTAPTAQLKTTLGG